MTRRTLAGFAAGGLLAAAMVCAMPTPSQAAGVSYSSSECSASSQSHCFAIFYNSLQSSGYAYSSCFLSNKSLASYDGYGTTSGFVAFEFASTGVSLSAGVGGQCTGSGDGQGVKNNAAAALNGDSVTNTVYYNTGYVGASQSFRAGSAANLNSTLKNENASVKRSS
jgi:hypothetical protein